MIDKIIDNLAICACFKELRLKSKPGLVTKTSSGSHKDMDYFTMKRGILSLKGYFGKSFLYGFLGKSFPELRNLGILYEKKMYLKTGNINTHLGAIFLLGILCFLVGRIKRKNLEINRDNFNTLISDEIKSDDDFKILKKEGNFGARKEVIDSYNMSFSFLDDAPIIRLLKIIKNLDDTNVKRRGGKARQRKLKVLADKALKKRRLYEINDFAVKNNLSPGGAADILINSIFINSLIRFEEKRRESYIGEKLSHNELIFDFISDKNICVYSLVFPGLEKDLSIYRKFYVSILDRLKSFGLHFTKPKFTKFGYYSFSKVEGSIEDFKALKKKFVEFEKIGLIDLDLYFNGKPISRSDVGLPQRDCLVCDKKAKECYINKRHTREELLSKALSVIFN